MSQGVNNIEEKWGHKARQDDGVGMNRRYCTTADLNKSRTLVSQDRGNRNERDGEVEVVAVSAKLGV